MFSGRIFPLMIEFSFMVKSAKASKVKSTKASKSTSKTSGLTATAGYEEIAQKLASNNDVQMSAMFGMPALKINGKAFAGLYQDAMVFKLTGEDHKKAISLAGAKLFDPAGRRPMKEWVQVPEASASKWSGFAEAALEYVSKIKK